MNCTFKKATENELRIKFEGEKVSEVVLYYKDKKGLEKGIEELKKRGLYAGGMEA